MWIDLVTNDSDSRKKKTKAEESLSVLFHFGMTGTFVIEGEQIPHYKSFKIQAETWPPKFSKIEMQLSNGKRVAFTDPRRFAR